MSDPLQDFLDSYQPAAPSKAGKVGKGKSAPRDPIFDDIDALDIALAKQERDAKARAEAEKVRTIAPTDPRNSIAKRLGRPQTQDELDAKIAAGQTPLPGGASTLWDAFKEADTDAAQKLKDRTLFGLPGAIARATGTYGGPVQPIPEPHPPMQVGKNVVSGRLPEDYLPGNDIPVSTAAAALDMATVGAPAAKLGQEVASAPAAIASRLGASEAQTAVRPGINQLAEQAATGAAFGATGAAMQGGGPAEIAQAAVDAAAGNVAMSRLPQVASAIESGAANRLTGMAANPLLKVGQGKTANKALNALGKGDSELGREELGRVLNEHGLVNELQGSSGRRGAQNAVESRLESVWENELGPIRNAALAVEPNASVPLQVIRQAMKELVAKNQVGTPRHDDVMKAVSEIEAKAKNFKGSQFPIENLLENAKAYENDGYGKTEPKFADGKNARDIGKTLRSLVDRRIGKIYERNPELTAKIAGFDETPEGAGVMARSPELSMEVVGDKYADARRRYSELLAIRDAAKQLSMRENQGRKSMTEILRTLAVGGAGFSGAGLPGLATGMGAYGLWKARPYAYRGARSLASQFAGEPAPAYTETPPTEQPISIMDNPGEWARNFRGPGGSRIAGALVDRLAPPGSLVEAFEKRNEKGAR